jgi:hypothetical protein
MVSLRMGGWWLKKTGVTDGRKMRPEAIPEDRFGTSLSVGIGLSRNDADHVGSPPFRQAQGPEHVEGLVGGPPFE